MPCLLIRTNVPVDDKPALLRDCSAKVAAMLGKPESYVMVQLADAQAMCFAASDAPLAFLELKSLGLRSDQTAALSAELCGLMETVLGIDPARVYIEFAAPERVMFGWNGGTF